MGGTMSVSFIAVRKDEQGKITHFLTDDGKTITFAEAKELVHNGEVDSLTEIHDDGGWEMKLETTPAHGNNLDDLPSF
jgi:hypothetical protein